MTPSRNVPCLRSRGGWHGGAIVGHQTYDKGAASLILNQDAAINDFWQVVHTHVSVTNL